MTEYEPTPECVVYYVTKHSGKPLTLDECELMRAYLKETTEEFERQHPPAPPKASSREEVRREIQRALIRLALFIAALFAGMLIWK